MAAAAPWSACKTGWPARPLLAVYQGGQWVRRYYQDAAIRIVLEELAAERFINHSAAAPL